MDPPSSEARRARGRSRRLDITWLRDESLEDLAAALIDFEAVAAALEVSSAGF